jgi:hypothetical protein
MSTDSQSIAEQLKVPPTTIEEAEYQLDLIKLAKKQLTIEKDYIMDQQRQEREQYSAQTNKNNTLGDGMVRLVSKEAADMLEGLGGALDDYQRRGLAKDLEPLEAERAMIEAALIALDQRALELEVWITMQELYPPEEGETVPPLEAPSLGAPPDGPLVVVPPGPPATLEEAEAQLELVKLRQKELAIDKRRVAEAERLAREANTSKDRKGAMRGKGLVAIAAPEVADVLEETQETANHWRDRKLGKSIEELEDERMAIEKELNQLELQEVELEQWIEMEEARLEAAAEKEAEEDEDKAKATAASTDDDAVASGDDDAVASGDDDAVAQAQAEAELAKAEAEKARAEAEKAKAEAEKAKAEAELARAEAEKAKAEAELAEAEAEAAKTDRE